MKKGNLFQFTEKEISKGAPNNLFSLITHYKDENGITKLVLKDPGSIQVLIANATDMQETSASFEDKLLHTLTDMGESFRLIAEFCEAKYSDHIHEKEKITPPETSKKNNDNYH